MVQPMQTNAVPNAVSMIIKVWRQHNFWLVNPINLHKEKVGM